MILIFLLCIIFAPFLMIFAMMFMEIIVILLAGLIGIVAILGELVLRLFGKSFDKKL